MKKLLVRVARQSPAMIVAMLALFVALTGTAVATTSALIGSAQIRNNSITGLDVKNRSLRPIDFRGSVRGPRGLRGPAGLAGAAGPQGPVGPQGPATGPAGGDLTGTYPNPSIADNAVSSAKVADGTLTGDDVGRNSGTASLNAASVAANTCSQQLLDSGTTSDMRDDAVVVTPDDTWPANVNVSTENSNSPGLIRLNICNPTAVAIDPPLVAFHWVAFDVTP